MRFAARSHYWSQILGTALVLAGTLAATPRLLGAPAQGKMTGIVVDLDGIPQMGASVWVLSEEARGSPPLRLFTNAQGLFSAERLRPGLYSVRVTLAGFLPAIEQHVRIDPSLPTILKIELDSFVTSVDRLRRKPNQEVEADDWMWILRTSAATRPVLRWVEGDVLLDGEETPAEQAKKHSPHGRVELTSGARRPGSVSNMADAPSSAFAYDQPIGHTSHLLLAGQFSYERSAAASLATTWLPSGATGQGPETSLVLRQSKLWLDGSTFRGVRMQHRNQLALGERFTLRYGADYVLVGLGRATSSLQPHGELVFRIAPKWRASLLVASHPWSTTGPQAAPLESTLAELDAFPAVALRNGRPVLTDGRHEELAVERSLGPGTTIVVSVFRDGARHTAVFGLGGLASPDFFHDPFSPVFSYDGGELNSEGARVAYRQKFSGDTETTLVYAFAGALTARDLAAGAELRDGLQGANHHSLAARVSRKFAKTHTNLAASYKWVAGPVVSRQDSFGEVVYQTEPNLNLSVRQPLPSFHLSGKLEALADFRNLLAQGYVPIRTRDGQIVLMPAYRSFRGGFSFQF